MALSSRAKCTRIISIFIVSSLLIVVSLIRVFSYHNGYNSHLLGTIMVILTIVLICCVLEICWRPFRGANDATNSSSESDSAQNINMEIPLVYSEAPPSYDEVVASFQNDSSHSVNTVGERHIFEGSDECPRCQPEVQELVKVPGTLCTLQQRRSVEDFYDRPVSRSGASVDDFEEVYIPRRYHPSSEIQLSVDALPSYEEAMTRLASDTDSGKDNNLIMFI
ncbi:hypothetical protein SK128_007693 [Halocaridina rubra]|uniref:Transmembrane protein n=1 Tax=Halocaridina rubra TaxID=373956 RepID=A0AAN8XGA9_HALRR